MDESIMSSVGIDVLNEGSPVAYVRRRRLVEPNLDCINQVRSLSRRADGAGREMTARTFIPRLVMTS